MREETILNYQNLVYKILSHYRNIYNYNRDFEEDYFHDGMVALIQAYDTYKDDNNLTTGKKLKKFSPSRNLLTKNH